MSLDASKILHVACPSSRMSAPGGETDIRQLGRDVRVLTLNGLRTASFEIEHSAT